MYIFVHPFFDRKIQIKYSRTELVETVERIQHPIVREVLKKFGVNGIDVNSIGDIPAGTGLGSSSSFTVGLLHALYAYTGCSPSKETLADEACAIEIDLLEEPIGKQDQYATSFGGLNFITFQSDGHVEVDPVIMKPQDFSSLEGSLLMFYLGKARSTAEVLQDQVRNLAADTAKFSALKTMAGLASQLKASLQKGIINDMGLCLHENWKLKKSLSTKISDGAIDAYYDTAINNGALGGKLLGAGGGGFFLFYCVPQRQEQLRRALSDLREINFKFDKSGTKVIYYDER